MQSKTAEQANQRRQHLPVSKDEFHKLFISRHWRRGQPTCGSRSGNPSIGGDSGQQLGSHRRHRPSGLEHRGGRYRRQRQRSSRHSAPIGSTGISVFEEHCNTSIIIVVWE